MGKKRRKQKKSIFQKIVISLVALIVVFIVGVGGFLAKTYYDVKQVANNVSQPVKGKREYPLGKSSDDKINDGEAFSVLLLGLDTGDFGRTDTGRSDTLMVATVNPKEKKTTLVSIPRDTRTDIVGHGTVDKINHAYAFGKEGMALATTEKLLDIPLDHYVWINMEGFEELVDAVGGVQVDNPFEFKQDGYLFKKGPNFLNGKQALAYTRMRYEDPKGDYGRQDRQRQVVSAIADQALSFNGITKYQQILKAIEKNMKTDLEWDDMFKIATDYRQSFYQIEDETLQGDGVMIDGVSYQEIPEAELTRVQNLLKAQLK